jgi:hypothetical protein
MQAQIEIPAFHTLFLCVARDVSSRFYRRIRLTTIQDWFKELEPFSGTEIEADCDRWCLDGENPNETM